MNTANLKVLKTELQADVLKILCDGALQLDWRELLDLQTLEDGRSLKDTDDEKILRLAESLLRFGIVNNLQVWFDENGDCYCFDAHHRRKAFDVLSQIGVEIPPLPATRCLAPSKVEAMRLLLVKESKSSWVNYKVVPDYLQETGFSFKVASRVIDLPEIKWNEICEAGEESEEERQKADEIPEQPPEVHIKTGDLIELGAHRLLCGDSIKAKDIKKLMGKEKADMVFTDPPFDLDDTYSKNIFKFINESCHVFIMNSDRKLIDNINKNIEFFRKIFVVDFRTPILTSNSRPMTRVDLIAEFNKGKGKFRNLKDGFSTLIKCQKLHGEKRGETYHKQEKKVELSENFILHYSNQDEIIMDIFLGAGSTLIAAEKNNRRCYGVELDIKWCSVIIQRWVDFTEINEIKINGKVHDWRELRGE